MKFIAEAASNHNGDLDRCLAFVDTAAAIGCQGVKFQLFRVSELFAPEILSQSDKHRQRQNWELPENFLPKIAARCREKNILFFCTPFSLAAVDAILPHVDAIKISSYELLWHDLLRKCAAEQKKLILSTGMATFEEIEKAVAACRDQRSIDLTLLHCVSSYPAVIEQCNLAVIETLRNRLNIPVGWSDHSRSEAVIARAVHRWEAVMVEFHLDLDGKGVEAAMGHCWLPHEAQRMIMHVRDGIRADGGPDKKISAAEEAERAWRADPGDGLRPFSSLRRTFTKNQHES